MISRSPYRRPHWVAESYGTLVLLYLLCVGAFLQGQILLAVLVASAGTFLVGTGWYILLRAERRARARGERW